MPEKKDNIPAKEEENKSYPSDSAGRIMTSKVPVVDEEASISDAEKILLKESLDFDTINYIYVTNKSKKLKGVVSIKEVFSHPGEKTKVKDLMVKGEKLITVRGHSYQKKAVLLAIKNNIKALPVVDKDNVFLGVLDSDSILKVVDNEHVEDVLRLGGIYHKGPFKNAMEISIMESLKYRLPWLALGLVGGLLIAGVIKHYEGIISIRPILAAFIPMVVYMSSAVAAQTQVLVVRDIASCTTAGSVFPFFKYLLKQLYTICIIGFIMSFILYFLSFLFYESVVTSIVLSAALFFAVLSSLFTGLIVPYVFHKTDLNPAGASGPLGTIIQDIVSVIVYFAIIMVLL